MTLKELQSQAKELGLKYTGLKKAELETLINDNLATSVPRGTQGKTPITQPLPPPRDVHGILELCDDGYGFLRCENYLTSSNDIFVPPAFIKKYRLRTGDEISGLSKPENSQERTLPLIYIKSINGESPNPARYRKNFDYLTPIYPDQRLHLESDSENVTARILDLFAPIGRGQRGLIVSPPKAGKTTIIKSIAAGITANHNDIKLIILLIDERPEEVTDIRKSTSAEVLASTFDKTPQHHIRLAEICLERAKRLVEQGKDVVILIDSITRLARSYNLTVPSSGKILSGGIDPTSFEGPKRFFGTARNIENGGSLTIIATALVDTGSKMDDIIYEEFKGTGNMEVHLDRRMQELRVFPAIDISKSGTRKEELLLTPAELAFATTIRRGITSQNSLLATQNLIKQVKNTKNNAELVKKFNKIQEGLA